MVQLLNFFHRKGFHRLLCFACQIGYLLKVRRFVKVRYHSIFRAYEFRVKGLSYLSAGPGWAYSFDFLKKMVQDSFCYLYMPKPDDCIIDIGAGLGEETVIYAMLVGSGGEVHALEANPLTYSGLSYLCDRNNFTWVKPHHLAIYKSEGEVTIEDDENNYLTNTINSRMSDKSGFVVRAESLDTFVKKNGIKKIDFLKSNIEGAEQFLIQGMVESAVIIKNLCISCHDFRHNYHNHGEFYMTKQKVKSFLEKQGFEVTMRNTRNRVIDDYIYAKNIRMGA